MLSRCASFSVAAFKCSKQHATPARAVRALTGVRYQSSAATPASRRYADKVTIVTGGSRGIGEGCVRAFSEAGSKVVFCGLEAHADVGKALEDSLREDPGNGEASFVVCDLTDHDSLHNLIDTTVGKHGRLDCLINNAGWHPPSQFIDDFTSQDVRNLMELNFIAVFEACKYALPHLRKTEGNIINMSSLVGYFGQEQAVTYAATKGAITAFSKALAIDEAANNVRVNAIKPGNIWTPLFSEYVESMDEPEEEIMGDIARQQKLGGGRLGTIHEVGQLALAIAADLTFTTGAEHIISGGAELGYGTKL